MPATPSDSKSKKVTTKETKKKRQPKGRATYDNRVRMYQDGKYHWIHEVNLYKNPTILIDVYKVFGITMLIFFMIMMLIQACADGISMETITLPLNITGLMVAIFAALGLLGYLLYAVISGGKYVVHFTLDDNGVVHEQTGSSKKASGIIGMLTALVGIFAKKPGVMGAGMMAGSRTAMSSSFADVKKVKAYRGMNMIKVNETFEKNRVYVNDEDFDFVYDYIRSRCPKAKS